MKKIFCYLFSLILFLQSIYSTPLEKLAAVHFFLSNPAMREKINHEVEEYIHTALDIYKISFVDLQSTYEEVGKKLKKRLVKETDKVNGWDILGKNFIEYVKHAEKEGVKQEIGKVYVKFPDLMEKLDLVFLLCKASYLFYLQEKYKEKQEITKDGLSHLQVSARVLARNGYPLKNTEIEDFKRKEKGGLKELKKRDEEDKVALQEIQQEIDLIEQEKCMVGEESSLDHRADDFLSKKFDWFSWFDDGMWGKLYFCVLSSCLSNKQSKEKVLSSITLTNEESKEIAKNIWNSKYSFLKTCAEKLQGGDKAYLDEKEVEDQLSTWDVKKEAFKNKNFSKEIDKKISGPGYKNIVNNSLSDNKENQKLMEEFKKATLEKQVEKAFLEPSMEIWNVFLDTGKSKKNNVFFALYILKHFIQFLKNPESLVTDSKKLKEEAEKFLKARMELLKDILHTHLNQHQARDNISIRKKIEKYGLSAFLSGLDKDLAGHLGQYIGYLTNTLQVTLRFKSEVKSFLKEYYNSQDTEDIRAFKIFLEKKLQKAREEEKNIKRAKREKKEEINEALPQKNDLEDFEKKLNADHPGPENLYFKLLQSDGEEIPQHSSKNSSGVPQPQTPKKQFLADFIRYITPKSPSLKKISFTLLGLAGIYGVYKIAPVFRSYLKGGLKYLKGKSFKRFA